VREECGILNDQQPSLLNRQSSTSSASSSSSSSSNTNNSSTNDTNTSQFQAMNQAEEKVDLFSKQFSPALMKVCLMWSQVDLCGLLISHI